MILMLLGTCNVYAYNSSIPFDENNVATWNQGGGAWAIQSTRCLNNGKGSTIQQAGCSWYGVTYMLIKGGYINPKKTKPLDIIDKGDKLGGLCDVSWGHFSMKDIGKIEPDLECKYNQKAFQSQNSKDNIALLKKLYDEGYYLLLCIGSDGVHGHSDGHYVFIDKFTSDGDFIIGDSGKPGCKWSEYYGKKGTTVSWKYVVCFKSKSGKLCKNMNSIYDDTTGKQTGDGTSHATQSEKLVAEKLMKDFGKEDGVITKCQENLELLSGKDMDIETKNSVSYISGKIYGEKEGRLYRYLRIASYVVGVLLLLYGILLVIAYIFDYSNTFIDISLVGMLTLGKYEIVEKSYFEEVTKPNSARVRKLTLGMLICRVVALWVVAVILLTGSLGVMILEIISGIRSV